MKFRIINTILFIIISLFSSFDVSYGATAIHSLRLTGYPDIDFEPTVSPNDEWIAFTSYRDGDFNIYLKSTSRGIPRRLTNHTSADFNPCFDNNSENVYFVSRRDDALGDIYKINIETGFIKRITDNKGYDSEPAISPDGKRLAFCSDRQSGYMDIFIAKKNGDIINRIPTSRGGINPSWSPDSKKLTFIALDTTGFGGANHLSISDLEGNIEYISTGTGPVMHPRFSHDGSMILMTQYSVDTNKDGTLTIDDIPCISAYIIEKQIIVKLIFADDAVFSATPSLNSKWLYYAVGKEKDIDIARIDFSRLWAIYSLPDSLYDYSQNFSTSTDSTELLTAIKYLESFSAIYKDNPDTPGAIIKCGDLYQKLGFYREAIAVWGKVDSEFDNTAYNIALLRIAGLQADRSWHLDRRSTLRRVLSRIKKIREQNKNDTSVTSEALYLKGNLLFRYGDFNQAVASFQAVVDSFSQNAEVSCRSLLRIADIYKTLDPRAKLANAENYLEVINQHPEQKAFADSAVVYALRQYEDQPVQERINGIRILLDNLKEKRLLQAAGEFEIARIHEGNGNYSGALDQYNSAAISYPEQISFSVNARLKSAELKLYSSEPEEGVSELESILNLGEADNDLKDKVKDIIYFYKLEQGRKSLQNINYPKARSVFEELIIKFPDRGGCHWGFMKCCAKLKDIDHADKFYGKLKKDGLISRGTSYGNALLSLEKYKQQDNKGELRRARELLEELNELFFDWIFPYVTLGDVYLRTEAAGIDKEIGGFSEKAIDMSLRGLISLGDDASEELKKNLTLNLATGYYYIGQYQQSFASYKSSGDFVKSLNDGVVLNDYLWNLGDAALQIDSLRRASSCFETLFKSAEERSDTYFKLRLLTKLGYVYLLQEEFDKARRYFNRALDIYTSLNDDQGKAEVLKALSATSFMDQEYGTCIKYVEISDSLYSILKPSDDIKTSNLLLGRLPLLPVDFQLAEIEEIKIGGSFFQKGFPFDVNRRLLNEFKAESYANLGEIHSAASCYKVKIHLEDKAGDSRSAGATANKLANMYQNAGMPDSSVVYYRQAIDYSKDASFYTGVAVNAVNLSNLLFSFPELRIKYSKESKEDIMSDLQVSIRNIAGEISAFKIYAYCALANWYYLDYTESIISKIGEHENSIVAADDWISSLKNDKFSSISENLLTAAKYYRNAREIALRLKDKHILAIVNRNLSIISANLGKINDYEDFLSKAETTSTENGFGDLLWRILIDREIISRSEVPDDENWNKAFEVLKTLRGYKNPFAFPQDKQLLEITFNRYLDYLIQNGQTTNALWALELFRSMKLAGEFARYPTRSFRSELHKVYWQNIHYLDSMTDSLSSMIWSLEAQGDLTSLNKIDSLNVELSSINDELSQTLEKIIAEYPGLSPLVYPTLPDSNDIRQFLGDEKIIFNFYVFENGIGTWLIDHDSTQFSFKPIENEILKKKVRTTVDSIGTPSADKYSEELFELLFGDHVESIENSGNIIIIPNDILYRLPFSLLNDGNLFLTDITDYSISSSFSMAVNGYLNRHIPSAGTIIIKDINDSISRRRKKKKYAIASSDSIPKAISDYGVLIFKDGINIEPGYPLGSTLNFPGKKKPQLSELLTYKLKSKAIILHDIDIGNLNVYSPLLQASFNYAGAPSLIINRWQIPDEVYNEFHSNFIPLLDSLDVVSSLGIAKSRLKNKYPDKMYWAGFELFGYDGMNKAEEFVFAEEKFGILMRKGNIAAGENHWDDALEYFKEANHLSSKLNFDDSQKLMILQRIVLSAFRGEQFLTAEEYQKEILQVWQSVEDTEEIQKAILNLRDIAVRGKNFAKAAGYQKQYVLLTRKISKSGDFAAGLGDVASLYDLAKDYKKAIAVTDSALLLASDDEKESVSARISFTKGKVLINSEEFFEAEGYLTKAVENYDSLGQNEDLAKSRQLLGTAYFRQNKYLDAEKQLSLALKTFEVLKDSLNLAGCAQLSASVKWAVGDYDSANTLARSAADYFKKHSDRKGYLDSKLVEALILIYSGFKEEGEKLLIHGYAKADSIRSKQHKTAFAGNLGRLYLRNDSLSKALDFFKFAIEYSEDKEATLEDRLEILLDLAYSAGLHEGYQVSLSYFANAESLSIKLNNEYYRNKIILLRAAVMEHDSDFNAAIKLLREKITITEIEKYPDLDWRKQYLEGLCKYKNGKPKIAFLILKRSAKILASQPVIPNGELLRSRLPFHPADVFELLAQCRFEMEEYQKALNNFQKASQYRQVSITSGFRVKYNDSTIDSLVSIITSSQLKYFAGMRYNNGRVNDIEGYESHQQQLSKTYFQTLKELAEKYPSLSLLYSLNDVDIPQIFEKSIDNPMIFLYASGNNLYRFLIKERLPDRQKFSFDFDLDDISRRYRSAIISLSSTATLDSIITPLVYGGLEDVLDNYNQITVIPLKGTSELPFTHLLNQKIDDAARDLVFVNILPSLYDLYIRDCPDRATDFDGTLYASNGGSPNNEAIDFFSKALTRQQQRDIYSILVWEEFTENADNIDKGGFVSGSGIFKEGDLPFNYTLGKEQSGENKKSLFDIPKVGVSKDFFLETSNGSMASDNMSSEDMLMIWRILLSNGYCNVILPLWEYNSYERAIVLKRFLMQIESNSPFDALLNIQKEIIGNGNKDPYHWSGYYCVGIDN